MAKLSPQQLDESTEAAKKLAQSFRDGQSPPTVAVPVNLTSGETCVGHTGVRTFEWRADESAEVHKSGGYFGLGGVPLIGTADIVGNTWRRAPAVRAAAPQWRPLDQGRLFVTDRRLAIQGEVRWRDIWFPDLRMVDCEPGSLVIEIAESPRLMLQLALADYWYVMLRKLVFGDVFTLQGGPQESGISIVKSTTPSRVPPSPQAPPQASPQAPPLADQAPPPLPQAPPVIDSWLRAAAESDVPTVLVGRWVGVHDPSRSLRVGLDGRFYLDLKGTGFSGPIKVTGTQLKLDSPGLTGDYDWTVDYGRLTLRHQDSVSEYARATMSVPSDLAGSWTSLASPGRVLSITTNGTFSLRTADNETTGHAWLDETQVILQAANLLSLYAWGTQEDILTLTKRDGSIAKYVRLGEVPPVVKSPAKRPR